MYKKIIVVDEKDNVLGAEEYFTALEKGCIRRASRVFVLDTEGKLLIQRRSKNISQPLLLNESAAGHVDEGGTYLEAAVREMKEEIGIEGVELREIASSYRTSKFFNTVYKAIVPTGSEVIFDEEEVDSVHWMTPEEIDRRLQEKPETFTGSFNEIWPKLRDKIID